MSSWGAVFGLLTLVVLAAPSGDGELRRCLDDCASAGAKTDRETCRLQCRQAQDDRGAPIQHWKRTELKGGSPDPNVEGGSTTVTVETGPDGTKTTITKTDRHGRTTTKTFAGTEAERQARIRGTGEVPFSWARRQQAWCQLGCAVQLSVFDRTRCRAACPVPEAAARPKPPKGKSATTPKPDRASCASDCRLDQRSCEAACPSRSSARNTCKLQCEATASACAKRC
jgi:hypothetical protein